MTWVKFEDRFPWHRKVRGLSDPAFRLHVSALCWSVEHLTDGKIETDDLPLVSDVRRPVPAVAELERKGLWDVLPDGWMLHDFLMYNEPRTAVLARREADAERKRKGREARTGKGSPAGVQPDVRPDSTPESARTDPARPEPKVKDVPSLRDDEPPGFAEFYAVYPRKVGRKDAAKAYRTAAKTTGSDVILAGAVRYRDDPNLPTDRNFIPHPATWLNAGQWDDEPLPPRIGAKPWERIPAGQEHLPEHERFRVVGDQG